MGHKMRKDFIKQKEGKKNQGFDEEAVEPTCKTGGGIVGQLVRVRRSARV